MSKRYIFQQTYGERKKAKLDITGSDHNFPLSQNLAAGKDGDQGNSWGDENDDEILLLASQACEEAYNNISDLPDYSMCMQPGSTSTQITDPIPSTSKSAFSFKKPTSSPLSMVTTKLKDKCERISSPLPGMSKVCKSNGINVSDDIIINDNIYKGQDSDHIYRQLLKLQEENAKLKSENGKLLEKCVTKEGEASILRTQLKSTQIAVDNARLEKVKAQEQTQMEWSDKLTTMRHQMNDLRTQLDFKNLEMISMKEKCKVLESNKVKLTQVTVAGNDISMSQRHNSSYAAHHDTTSQHFKKLKTTSSSAQTEDKLSFIQLNIPGREETSTLSQILPFIIKPTDDECCILDYNEKLRHPAEPNKCRIYSTFHRLPAEPRTNKERSRRKLPMDCIYGSLMNIITQRNMGIEDFLQVYKTVKEALQDVICDLEVVSQRMTTAFHREMDERYIDATSNLVVVEKQDLLNNCTLYKEEQAIQARRMAAVLVYILEDARSHDIFDNLLREEDSKNETSFVNIICKICTLLDNNTCAVLYSGVLLSITLLIKLIMTRTPTSNNKITLEAIKTIALSRPMPFVSCEILKLLAELLCTGKSVKEVCCKSVAGNLKVDYDQGVLLYKKDSCVLQVLLKQIETCLKCIEKNKLVKLAIDNCRCLLTLYGGINGQNTDGQEEKHRCDCQLVLMQVIVYALSVCANMLNTHNCTEDGVNKEILAVCRSGTVLLYRGALRDVEFASRLGHDEGRLLDFTELLRGHPHADLYSNMLSEITSTFQSAPEETAPSYHQKAWVTSFRNFTIAD